MFCNYLILNKKHAYEQSSNLPNWEWKFSRYFFSLYHNCDHQHLRLKVKSLPSFLYDTVKYAMISSPPNTLAFAFVAIYTLFLLLF